MAWRLAPAVKAIFDSANRIGPNRSKASDGTIGDPAHRQRSSDHNPNAQGYVMAGDITHDPAHGIDCNTLAEMARVDWRTKYVIWNRRIARGGEAWRRYTGANPHDKHMHVSVTEGGRDRTHPWFAPPQPQPPQQEDDMTKAFFALPPKMKDDGSGPHPNRNDLLFVIGADSFHLNDEVDVKFWADMYGLPVPNLGSDAEKDKIRRPAQVYSDLWARRARP